MGRLDQGLANFFYTGPDSKYFKHCRLYGLSQLLKFSVVA